MPTEKKIVPKSKSQRVAILGGSGFIGRALAKSLALSGYNVVTASRRPILSDIPNLTSVLADVTKPETLEAVIEGADTVIQLTNGINPSTGNSHLIKDIEQELVPQIRIMELCVKNGVGRVIFASSGGAVYGNALDVPTRESYVPVPRNSYGLIKNTIEKYLEIFQIEHGLDYITLRLSNPYGPGQNFRRSQGFLVPSLIEKIEKNEEITIFGDGNDSRDYVYIDDVVDAIDRAIELEGPAGKLLNIGGGAHYTVNDVIAEIESVLGRPVSKSHLPRRGSDIPRSFLDISLAKEQLGWTPKVDLNTGLTRVLASDGLI